MRLSIPDQHVINCLDGGNIRHLHGDGRKSSEKSVLPIHDPILIQTEFRFTAENRTALIPVGPTPIPPLTRFGPVR